MSAAPGLRPSGSRPCCSPTASCSNSPAAFRISPRARAGSMPASGTFHPVLCGRMRPLPLFPKMRSSAGNTIANACLLPKIHTEQLHFRGAETGRSGGAQDHGIGQYEGLMKLTVDGPTNDFLLITYRDEDKLYLPVDRMNMIQKYMGVDGAAPVLDKMGGKSWDRVRAKVKQSTEKIAGELLKLYAARKVAQGIAFTRHRSIYFRILKPLFL